MIPSKELVKDWAQLKQPGDNEKLSKILKMTTQNVSRVRNGGSTTLSKIKKMVKFYEARKAEKEKYTEQDQD